MRALAIIIGCLGAGIAVGALYLAIVNSSDLPTTFESALIAYIAIFGPAYAVYLWHRDRQFAIVIICATILSWPAQLSRSINAWSMPANVIEGFQTLADLFSVPSETAAQIERVLGALIVNAGAATTLLVAAILFSRRNEREP